MAATKKPATIELVVLRGHVIYIDGVSHGEAERFTVPIEDAASYTIDSGSAADPTAEVDEIVAAKPAG